MADMQKQKLEEQQANRSKWESRFGQFTVGAIVTGWVTSGSIEQTAMTVAAVSAIGYLSLRMASNQTDKKIAQEQENFIRAHGADKNIRKYEELQKVEKKVRRNRNIVFAASSVSGVVGAVVASQVGYPEFSRALVFVGLAVGSLASAFTSRKTLNNAVEQKSSLVNALEARRSQMETAQTASAPKM